MTAAKLPNLLIAALVREHGGSRGIWRRAIGAIHVYPLATHPHCNWDVSATGTAARVEAVNRAVDRLRERYPEVD